MILYFSATGNCKFIAQSIASKTADIAISIADIKKVALKDGEQLGIVSPTYFWRLPSIVEDFLKNIIVENVQNCYTFFIATYGTTCGQTDYYAKRLLRKKGIRLNASFGIKTVDNWTVEFNVADPRYLQETLQYEQAQIKEVVAQIQSRESVFISKDKRSLFLCNGAKHFYNRARQTTHLNVNSNCIGCGLCQKNCVAGAIRIANGKPIWIKKQCVMCFGCLHNCPTFAINYDDKTQNNGQYNHPPFEN